MWNCECICGKKSVVHAMALKSGNTKGCGCSYRKRTAERMTTHGKSHSPEYNSWSNMRKRCLNPRYRFFYNYGGRGIAICERWNSFESFLADMGSRPKGLSLERKDNSGNYTPENCVWASNKEQSMNTRVNVHITIDGVTKHPMEWSKISGVPWKIIRGRTYHGWPPERCVFQPPRKSKRFTEPCWAPDYLAASDDESSSAHGVL